MVENEQHSNVCWHPMFANEQHYNGFCLPMPENDQHSNCFRFPYLEMSNTPRCLASHVWKLVTLQWFLARMVDPGSWLQDPGSRIQDILDPGYPGSRILDPGYPGSRILNPGSWITDPGSSKILDPGCWIQPKSKLCLHDDCEMISHYVFIMISVWFYYDSNL